MCSAIRRASSATAARATASPACAAAKIARPSYGGVSVVARARRRREPFRDGRERGRARVDVLVEPGRGVVELARRAVVAAVQLAAQHEPRAESGADREEDEVVDAVGGAAPALAERREVDVVPHRDGESQRLAQLAPVQTPLETGDVGDETDPVAVGLDGAGNADDDAVDRHPVEAGGGDERVAQGGDGREHGVGVRLAGADAAQLDVLPRADHSAEVAEGGTQEPRAEVEPEHERRLGHRLVEHGAVGRALRQGSASRTSPASRRASSASETVGLEMPARRAISAREIGAPSRIASSTVRSFSRLSSGGVAR